MTSLNRVQLIGEIANDPELRYTPSGELSITHKLGTFINNQFPSSSEIL